MARKRVVQPDLPSPPADGSMTPSFLPNASAPLTPSGDDVSALIASQQHHEPHNGKYLDVDDLDIPDDLDWNEEIASLLRSGTSRAHMKAEHSAGAAALVKGELDLQEYIRWLAILWRVYDALELGLTEYASNPVLAPTYDPQLLARAPPLARDITHFLSLLPADLTAGPASPLSSTSSPPPFPVPPFLQSVFDSPPAPVQVYVSHLRHLASSSATAPSLLAHAYVRYLGDLSGGQVIRGRIKKAYGLKGDNGIRFFLFPREGEEGGEAGEKQKMVEVKDWYRRGMNEGVGDDKELKKHLVKEANLAFLLNTHLFSVIEAPSNSQSSSPETSIRTPRTKQVVIPGQKEQSLTKRDVLGWLFGSLAFALVLSQLMTRYAVPYIDEHWVPKLYED